MSEKQFELRLCSNGSYYLWDNGDLTDISFDKFNKEAAEEMCNRLNELHKLNEQLKKKNITVQKVFAESQDEWAESVNKLHEENQQIKDLIHTMLRQIDVENITSDSAIYSARIIFSRNEFNLIRDLWKRSWKND